MFASMIDGVVSPCRKWTLVLNNVFAVAGALMMALSSSFWLFLAGRFVSGFASGTGTFCALEISF